MEPPGRLPSERLEPDQEAWGWTTVLTEEGRKRAVISAEHFQKFISSRKATLDGGISVVFYDAFGIKPVSKLTAQKAEIDETTGNMVVFGDVLLVSEDSTQLATDTLSWSRKNRQIVGPGEVVIRRPDGVESGIGFEAASDLKRWTLRRVVTRFGRIDSLHR